MARKADHLARIEAALGRVEAAGGQIRDVARGMAAILSRLDALDRNVADLAEAVRVVMAARTERESAPAAASTPAALRPARTAKGGTQ